MGLGTAIVSRLVKMAKGHKKVILYFPYGGDHIDVVMSTDEHAALLEVLRRWAEPS